MRNIRDRINNNNNKYIYYEDCIDSRFYEKVKYEIRYKVWLEVYDKEVSSNIREIIWSEMRLLETR
jgi:ABC-type Zn uptake system ZnuABC Zn-binding protein ZnuA